MLLKKVKKHVIRFLPSYRQQQKLLYKAYQYQQLQEFDEAIALYKMLSKKNCHEAQHNLACMYLTGEGLTKSYHKAIKWFEFSAKNGNAGAQYNLALIYSQGEAVEKSYQEAIKWCQLAVKQGNKEAKDLLKIIENYLNTLNEAGIKTKSL